MNELTYTDLIAIRNILIAKSLKDYREGKSSGTGRLAYALAQKINAQLNSMEEENN